MRKRLTKVVISPDRFGGGWLKAEYYRQIGANEVLTETWRIDRREYQTLRKAADSEELSDEYLRLTLYPATVRLDDAL